MAAEALQVQWVTLARYCELTGDTAEAVRGRKKAGKWVEGVHWCEVDRRLWVHLGEVQRWVEQGGGSCPSVSRLSTGTCR